jgi:hypothetical protein
MLPLEARLIVETPRAESRDLSFVASPQRKNHQALEPNATPVTSARELATLAPGLTIPIPANIAIKLKIVV